MPKARPRNHPGIALYSEGYEAVIDPEVGRVIYFGRSGGPNAFWVNPSGWDVCGWNNLGGEKVWLWPQDLWPEYYYHNWPPPLDGRPWKLTHGLDRAEWELCLQPIDRGKIRRRAEIKGPVLRIISEFRDTSPDLPFRLWSITQIPLPNSLRIPATSSRCHPDPGHVFSRRKDEWTLRDVPDAGGKWFFDGDRISASTPAGTLDIQNLSWPSPDPQGPLDSLQIFFDAKTAQLRPSRLPPYAELEFVAPPGSLSLELIFSLETCQEAVELECPSSTP